MKLESRARRIRFVRLSVVGGNVPPAEIDFGPKLTVVHGASDTGKSHVFELIHFALGLQSSFDVPDEAEGYSYVHLTLDLPGHGRVTLSRDFGGGKIGVYEGELRSLADAPASVQLQPNHTSKDPNSVSRFVLRSLGLDETMVRTSQFNQLRMLELRDVFHLAAVGEEKILSKASPIEFGQYSKRPAELAIFRLFLQCEDDSDLTPIAKSEDLKKISENKISVLDELIVRLERQLADEPGEEELRDQTTRLQKTISSSTSSVEASTAKRQRAVADRGARSLELARVERRRAELRDLMGRFGLLLAQYDSDLARISMLHRASDVLGAASGQPCPFCGAESHAQNWNVADGGVEVDVQAALEVEAAKTATLREDLAQSIADLEVEANALTERASVLSEECDALASEISALDAALSEPGSSLAEATQKQLDVRRLLDLHAQLRGVVQLRAEVAVIERPKTDTSVPIRSESLRAFDEVASAILESWDFSTPPMAVSFSEDSRDLTVGRKRRRAHGKGVRSVLHALFNLALAQYCVDRDVPHPGVVILDSPVVSYRQPGDVAPTGEDETILVTVVDAFYAYLQGEFDGQTIVFENKSPVAPLPEGAVEHFFAGELSSSQRAGFYPRNG